MDITYLAACGNRCSDFGGAGISVVRRAPSPAGLVSVPASPIFRRRKMTDDLKPCPITKVPEGQSGGEVGRKLVCKICGRVQIVRDRKDYMAHMGHYAVHRNKRESTTREEP
jgi:hypothetical protein